MICLKCGTKINDDDNKCPVCGNKMNKKDLELELPVLKNADEIIELDDTDSNLGDNDFEIEIKEEPETADFDKFDGIDDEVIDDNENIEEDISLEKTISISSVDDLEEQELSLLDDINNQIDEINKEALEKENEESEDKAMVNVEETETDTDEKEDTADLSSQESIKSRKNIFAITGVFFLVGLVIILGGYFIYSKVNSNKIGDDYITALEESLKKYYNTNEIDDVVYVLESVKKDSNKVKEVQMKTRTICNSWVLHYLDEEINSLDEFNEISGTYKNLLNGLHTYAIVKYNDKTIRLLENEDYEELIKQLEDIYSDSNDFIEAMTLYTENDYNKAYYRFDRIEENNKYYEKAVSYKNKITDDIINLLNKDISKIEKDIDTLSDEDKLETYIAIEEVILEYNNVYGSTDLSDKEEYQKILSNYTSKVTEYTEKVANGNNNSNNNVQPEEQKPTEDNNLENDINSDLN